MSAPAPTILQEPVRSGSNIIVSWTGGVAPFQLQKTDSFPANFQNIGNPTMARSKTVPATGPRGFFRVQEQVPLLDADFPDENTTRLFWSVPDLE